MEPSRSPDDVDVLFALADAGVRAGLRGERAPRVEPETLPAALRQPSGAFVTLEVDGDLNGCIGSVVPKEPLGAAIAELAWRAAFTDPRLPALTAEDYPSLEIKLSVIGPLERLDVSSEAELAAGLRPGVDGLLIRWGTATATFLPAVWPKIPDAATFLRQLWLKAGLRPGHWPRGLEAWRYETVDYRRRAVDIDPGLAACLRTTPAPTTT